MLKFSSEKWKVLIWSSYVVSRLWFALIQSGSEWLTIPSHWVKIARRSYPLPVGCGHGGLHASLSVGRSGVEVMFIVVFWANEAWHQSVCEASSASGWSANNSWKFAFVLHRDNAVQEPIGHAVVHSNTVNCIYLDVGSTLNNLTVTKLVLFVSVLTRDVAHHSLDWPKFAGKGQIICFTITCQSWTSLVVLRWFVRAVLIA